MIGTEYEVLDLQVTVATVFDIFWAYIFCSLSRGQPRRRFVVRSPYVANNESAQRMAPVTFVSDLRWSDQFLFGLQILRSRIID